MLEHLPTLILCGGDGTRAKALFGGMPKVLFPCLNGSVLGNVSQNLVKWGLSQQYFLCSRKYTDISSHIRQELSVSSAFIIEETKKLGTGGAVSLAISNMDISRGIFVVNGDTLFDCNNVVEARIKTLDINCTENNGAVFTAEPAFREQLASTCWPTVQNGRLVFSKYVAEYMVSAGVYFFGEDVCKALLQRKGERFHLEADFLISSKFKFHTVSIKGKFFDLGTPERYSYAKGLGIV